MKYEVHMIWTSDQMRRIWKKNMKTVHDNKKNASALIKKFHQDYSSQSVLIEWVKKENQQLLSKTQIMKTAR